jgi:hypothetical protein
MNDRGDRQTSLRGNQREKKKKKKKEKEKKKRQGKVSGAINQLTRASDADGDNNDFDLDKSFSNT